MVELTSTAVKYNAIIGSFIRWGGFCPCDTLTVLKYIEDRAAITSNERIKLSTLKTHLAAIRDWHLSDNWSDPTDSPIIKKELRRLQALERQNEIYTEESRFITPEEALNLTLLLIGKDKTPKDLRDRLLMTIGLMSGHRAGMLARIKIEHLMNLGIPGSNVIIDTPEFKTNNRDSTFIPFTGAEFCPATWLRDYVKLYGLKSGYLFRPIKAKSDNPISVQSINKIVKSVIAQAGITGGKLSSHTFRKSMASIAALEGVNSVDIAAQGSWSGTETVDRYYVSKAVSLKGRAPLAVIGAIRKAYESLQGCHEDSKDFLFELKGHKTSLNYQESLALYESLKEYLSENRKGQNLLG